jgi:hypothetical protein
MLLEFDSREDFARAVEERVAAAAPAEELQRAMVEAIMAAEDEFRSHPSSSSDLNLRIGHWFLRNEDVPFLDSVSAAGAFAAAAAGGAALAPAAVAAAAAFVGIMWRVWRRGGRLSDDQVAVLAALNSRGPLNYDDLLAQVKEQESQITSQRLRDALLDLEDFEFNNGVTAPLVRKLDDSRWRALRT